MFGERVLDAVPETVFVFDPSGRLVWWNQHATRATGYGDAELAALEPRELVVDDERDRFEAWVGSLFEGEQGQSAVETTLVGADGEPVPYEFVGAVLDDNGGAAGAVATGRDISERRARQELERQNERLEEFASVVSHDLRNPLTVAEGYLSLARLDVDNDDLEQVASAHKRMYDLIEDLLTLARAGRAVGEPEPVDLGTVARQGWASVETGESELQVTGDATFEADPRRLRELFENLFRNAIEHGSKSPASKARQGAVEHGTTPHVPIGEENGGGDVPTVVVTVGTLEEDGECVGFYVEDDGPGIPKEIRDEVFESGYTTGEGGTGFGLAIVEDIVEAHGWRVAAVAGSSGGARFEVQVTDPTAPE
jgi:PAS domain S-box-containing protein